MPTKEERNLHDELGPSPWPLYDEEEPYKNLKRMLKLEQRFDYQYEVAHVLGCSESQVSYWTRKAHEAHDVHLEDGDDIQCEICGGDTPLHNVVCDECLDKMRHADAEV